MKAKRKTQKKAAEVVKERTVELLKAYSAGCEYGARHAREEVAGILLSVVAEMMGVEIEDDDDDAA